MLKKEEKKIAEENELLNIRRNNKLDEKFKKSKKIIFILSVFLSIVIITTIYFLLDISNVKDITVENNHYLTNEDVVKISGIDENDKFLFVFASKVKAKLLENPIIADCQINKLDDRSIEIVVTEKKLIGYTLEDNENVLILEDDSRIVVDRDNLYLISYVPVIEGFLKEDIVLIEKSLKNVDYKLINEVSEIHNYVDLKYQNVQIIMRDGNYIFTSVYGLDVLNDYYSIASSYNTSKHLCYYHEDISGNSYTSACPWG